MFGSKTPSRVEQLRDAFKTAQALLRAEEERVAAMQAKLAELRQKKAEAELAVQQAVDARRVALQQFIQGRGPESAVAACRDREVAAQRAVEDTSEMMTVCENVLAPITCDFPRGSLIRLKDDVAHSRKLLWSEVIRAERERSPEISRYLERLHVMHKLGGFGTHTLFSLFSDGILKEPSAERVEAVRGELEREFLQ